MDGRKNRPYRNLVTESHVPEVGILRINRLVIRIISTRANEQYSLTELKVCVEVVCVGICYLCGGSERCMNWAKGVGEENERGRKHFAPSGSQAIMAGKSRFLINETIAQRRLR